MAELTHAQYTEFLSRIPSTWREQCDRIEAKFDQIDAIMRETQALLARIEAHLDREDREARELAKSGRIVAGGLSLSETVSESLSDSSKPAGRKRVASITRARR